MCARPTPWQQVSDAALDELAALYRQLDERLDELAPACRQCGQCCEFARKDYRLFASHLERALVLRRHAQPRLTPSGACCFLVEGRCSIHPLRPLACRVYFCDPAHKAREQDIYHAFQRRVRALTDKHHLAWNYAPFFAE